MESARHTILRHAVRYALLVSALPGGVHVAAAQDNESQPEELVVTGSRIVTPNLESISPVTSISSEDITQTGKVRVEDIVNQLPQAFAAQGSAISNAADGTASVNLRGLGAQRTLVLVNGRRLMPGDPVGGSAADLNQIPSALVKRVEVLTGGASSVYGADAVAGVVNFIMDTEFEGVRLETSYSVNQHENDNPVADVVESAGFALPEDDVDVGDTRDFTFALGVGGEEDRAHAVFYATYREVDAVLQSEFDYSACTLNSGETYTCGGSATAVPGAFTLDFDDIDTIGADGELRDFDFATDVFNFGPTNYYQRPDERYTAGAFVDYELNDSAEVYGELMFMNDRSVSQIAPSGAFLGTGPYDINCDSPLLSQSMVDTWCGGVADDSLAQVFIGRRNVEGGGRQNDITHESFRIVAGVRGDITDLWSYDASLQHGTTNRSSTFLNDFSVARINNALSVDPVDPSVCLINADADPSNDDPECVPWNIFQPGGVTQEALDYLQVPGIIRAQATQRVLNANVTGDLSEYVRLPSAGGGLVVNVGAEYRHEETEFNPDLAFQTGDLAGQGAPTLPLAGQFHVRELFFEGRLPLIEGMTGVRALSFETGYRYSEYSTDFDTDTYKFGLDWEPIESLRFRGSFQHAVRAPNVGELFGSQLVALNGTSDPCAGEDPSATEEECARTGVLPGQYGNIAQNPANQYNGLVGGNPDLQPEEAETVSFGLVWQPEFAPNLSLAVDWFDIEVDDVISAGGLQDAFINDCLATGNEATCSLIHRDQFGSLWATPEGYVEDTSLNIGGLATTGFDVQAGYAFDAGAHHVALSLIGTVLDELSVQPLASGDSYDCAGFYGSTCGVPNPEWRHRLTTTWSTPWLGIDVTAAWRFYDSVDNQLASPDDLLSPGDAAPQATDAHFASRSYIDLTGAITFADRYTLRIGANNLLDKDPPLVGGDQCPTGPCNGNTFPQVYDTLGRQLFATFTMDF